MFNYLKLWNYGGWHLSWRWYPLTILSSNLLEVMLPYWYRNWRRVSTCTAEEDGIDESIDCNTSRIPCLTGLSIPRISEINRCATTWLPTTLMTLSSSVKVRLFAKGALESGTGCFWTLNQKWASCLALSGWRKGKVKERLLNRLLALFVSMFIIFPECWNKANNSIY